MRTLEDCKAEVFRRSEERIKERKRKRNRMLACCIPLCLLLVTGGLYVRPLFEAMDEMAKSGGTNRMPDRVVGGMDTSLRGDVTEYSSVSVTKGTGSEAVTLKVTDVETMGDLCGFMAMYFDMSETKESYSEDGTDGSIEGLDKLTVKAEIATGTDYAMIVDELKEKYGLEEKRADYMIVFRESTGVEKVFCLLENSLYNENTGCMVRLSDEQLTVLETQLEQVLENEER